FSLPPEVPMVAWTALALLCALPVPPAGTGPSHGDAPSPWVNLPPMWVNLKVVRPYQTFWSSGMASRSPAHAPSQWDIPVRPGEWFSRTYNLDGADYTIRGWLVPLGTFGGYLATLDIGDGQKHQSRTAWLWEGDGAALTFNRTENEECSVQLRLSRRDRH